MKTIPFPEANIVAAKNQPQYQQMPCYIDPAPDGKVIACWQLTWYERLQVLLTGKVWTVLLCFHQPITPQRVEVFKHEVLTTAKPTWFQRMFLIPMNK